jgi:hypothetical protein
MAAQTSGCIGDCNSDAAVTISELVTIVGIALGDDVDACPPADLDGTDSVTINEVTRAVASALGSCRAVESEFDRCGCRDTDCTTYICLGGVITLGCAAACDRGELIMECRCPLGFFTSQCDACSRGR